MTKYAFKMLTFCVWESRCREYRNSLNYSFKFSINLSYFKVMSLKEREREEWENNQRQQVQTTHSRSFALKSREMRQELEGLVFLKAALSCTLMKMPQQRC